ncbi:restriction endonuclease subunit S [Paenibacillus sp.]|uniref:restriction endonuclease subunit S n=1 Tax=Paenibacillus sp. TaxID=58172 RepID=UPI002D2D0C56|nr:restriction endonuclease subunit S [Paenibacillus sp.]HZG56428.1 restriction endonuclease subunit S [Paenibacillus sp.]
MSARTKAALRMLAASAHMQWSAADLLEAKATEMETLRDWVLESAKFGAGDDANAFVAQSCEFHMQLIELLQGMTKLEAGLASHLKLLIEEEEALPFGGGDLLADGGGGL